jgi:hypothetical protein
MIKESQAREMAKEQRYAAMMNVAFVLDNVVPRISSQLNVSIWQVGSFMPRELCIYKLNGKSHRNTLIVLYLSLIHYEPH